MSMLKGLIIDDEKSGRDLLQLSIERISPYFFSELKLAGSGKEAREILNFGFIPDVVFLDINMPGEDAFEFLAKIEFKNYHIIFVTGYECAAYMFCRLILYSVVIGYYYRY